jgi:transposase
MSRYLGVDLHRNCFTVCTRLETGRQYLSGHRLEDLAKFTARLRSDDEVAVEVTGNTRLFRDAVAPHVARVAVVNPFQFEVIRKSVKKTDEHDARALALFLSKDMLPEVRMKDPQHAEMASLAQTRDTLVKSRTALKNKVNNLLSARGINLSKEFLASEKGLREVLGMYFGTTVDIELKVLVEQIRGLNHSIAELEKAISEQGPKLPGHENLKSIKGIGDVGAGVLLSVIGDVNDFADEGKLAAYFGIVPRVSNSNQTEHTGRITKRGSKLGRTVLIQCALIAKRYSAYLARYYDRIKTRRGTGKAIVALARKFLGVIYRTLKENLIWEDFPNGVIREMEDHA